jgi:hypothetical protein
MSLTVFRCGSAVRPVVSSRPKPEPYEANVPESG